MGDPTLGTFEKRKISNEKKLIFFKLVTYWGQVLIATLLLLPSLQGMGQIIYFFPTSYVQTFLLPFGNIAV